MVNGELFLETKYDIMDGIKWLKLYQRPVSNDIREYKGNRDAGYPLERDRPNGSLRIL